MFNLIINNPLIASTFGFEMMALIALAVVIIIALVAIVVLNKRQVDPNEEAHDFDEEKIAKKSYNKGMAKPTKTLQDDSEEFDYDTYEQVSTDETIEIKVEVAKVEDAEEEQEIDLNDKETTIQESVEDKKDAGEESKITDEKNKFAKENLAAEIKKEETNDQDQKTLTSAEIDLDNEHDSSIHGKYEIREVKGDYKYSKYIFELIANNGTMLFQSQTYASLQGCKAAIATFKKNVSENEFLVEKIEDNKFKYVLRKGKSLYEGKDYTSEQSALAGIDSVKRFSQTDIIEIV